MDFFLISFYKGVKMRELIEGYLGKSIEGKKSKMPAKLDFIQSASGLFFRSFYVGAYAFCFYNFSQ